MNTALKFLVGAALALAMSACSKETTEKKVDDVNSKITRMNTIAVSLQMEGINVGARGYSRLSSIPSGLSSDKVTYIRGLLSEYVSLGDQVLMKTNDKDVVFSDSVKLRSNVETARDLLKEMETYESRETAERSRQQQAERSRQQQAERDRNRSREREQTNDRAGRDMRQREALRDSHTAIMKLANEIREIKIKHFVNISNVLTDGQFELKNTTDLENLRRDTRQVLATANRAMYEHGRIDFSLVENRKAQEELAMELKTYASNIEGNLRRMNYLLNQRTGERRTDMDGVRTRAQ